MSGYFHSVSLDSDKCKGCINCIKHCPTEAIRVRNGKAHIITERCIDCGECIRVCPNRAKLATYDSYPDSFKDFKYKVALPAPSLYGQFKNLDDVDILLNGFIKLGFDAVFEVAKAAEIASDCTRRMIADNVLKKPIISTACPTVVRLIRVRFPELLDNILPISAPVDIAAALARKEAIEKTGLDSKDIGIIFISPCVAKNSAVKAPLGIDHSEVDRVIAIKDIYPHLAEAMREVIDEDSISCAGRIGVGWASSGGEAAGSLVENYLAADGIENVIKVIEDLEDEKFTDLDFIELNACAGGCVGGILTVENPYVAKARLKKLRKYLPVSVNHVGEKVPEEVLFTSKIEHSPIFSLSNNRAEAMRRMRVMDEIARCLPGLDCGSCGAPSCRALAEDVVRGNASEGDCIFRLKEHIKNLVEEFSRIDSYVPPPFRNDSKTDGKK